MIIESGAPPKGRLGGDGPRARLLLLVAGFTLASSQAVAATDPDLRSHLEKTVLNSDGLEIPANVDRNCVLDRAVIAYPSVAKVVDSKTRFIPMGGGKNRVAAIVRMKALLAVASGLRACSPASAQGAKSGR